MSMTRNEADEMVQIRQWMGRHGLLDLPVLTADDVLDAVAYDRDEAERTIVSRALDGTDVRYYTLAGLDPQPSFAQSLGAARPVCEVDGDTGWCSTHQQLEG